MASTVPALPQAPAPVLARIVGMPTADGPLDLEVRRGDVVLLEGPNGSGKTSLLRALAGLPAARAPRAVELGAVRGSGRQAAADPRRMEARQLADAVGFAPQDPREGLVGLTVRSEFRLRRSPLPSAGRWDSVAGLADRDVATLSSGEARRVCLSAVVAPGAPLLLLDEPTEGLDDDGRQRLVELVAQARERGAVVVADHDGLLAPLAKHRVRLGMASPAAAVPLPPPGEHPLVRAEATSVRLGGTTLRFPALALPAGLHAVAGPNGAGKSTLLLRLSGLRHGNGVHLLGGRPEPGRDARLLLPHAGDLFTRATVSDELGGGDPVGLVPPELLKRHPLSLSAGEAERVALAKTLGAPAKLYLLDEPEAHLDAAGRALLLDLIARRIAGGAVVVLATHDARLIAAAHSIIRLEAGGPS